MKRLLLAASVLFMSSAVMAQQTPDEVMKVNTEKYDFGKIKQNVPVSVYFELTNTSNKPLVVENTWGTCGCTTPEKPTEPIMPGKTAKVKVVYNAAALATFSKDVFIKLAGIEQPKNVKISGEVLDTKAYDAYVAANPKSK
ncbi:MAG: DUF1573 domain-containing protein [Chitinophagaceae bacterium]|nr:DUF1573 domain-containing protein [Chitinophagaceae bacterium]